MKLSNRLKLVEKMVEPHYTHIWDCCCDHGFLGASLLSKQAGAKVHFVDIVPDLIDSLENKLSRYFTDSAWETHCLDVSQLPLQRYEGSHLVIIAGVGGDLTAQFVEAICTQHPTLNIDFLLCPVHHHFSLRQKLIELQLDLKQEALIKENHRFYEVILVSSASENTESITPVGSQMWRPGSIKQLETAKEYLNQTLNHYQRVQLGRKIDVQHIIDAYSEVKISMCIFN
ncbi:tRNA (adenine(22)-N(1))-methyltransferase TrmK [Photobacterium ganghwense]|nr:tRNA (adenine(22)-N(1))-methyltransferase TrmK [Photobacterium ganghwense]